MITQTITDVSRLYKKVLGNLYWLITDRFLQKKYTVTCTNTSEESSYFYMFQRLNKQQHRTASLVWIRSKSKIGKNVSIRFSWNKTFSVSWQGYGLVQPRFIHDVQGKIPVNSNKTKATFRIQNSTPSLTLDENMNCSNLLIIVDESVPINEYAVGIGMDEHISFIEQALPGKTHLFEKETSYWLAFGDDIYPNMVLSESNTHPKTKITFTTTKHLNLEFNGTQFLRKEYKRG